MQNSVTVFGEKAVDHGFYGWTWIYDEKRFTVTEQNGQFFIDGYEAEFILWNGIQLRFKTKESGKSYYYLFFDANAETLVDTFDIHKSIY